MNWKETFLESLKRHSDNRLADTQKASEAWEWYDYPAYDHYGSLDEHLNMLSRDKNENVSLFEVSLNAFIHHEIDKSSLILKDLSRNCESPIEEAMSYALFLVANYNTADGVRFFSPKQTSYLPRMEEIIIRPQVQIEKYRVDFLLELRVNRPRLGEDAMGRGDFIAHKKISGRVRWSCFS